MGKPSSEEPGTNILGTIVPYYNNSNNHAESPETCHTFVFSWLKLRVRQNEIKLQKDPTNCLINHNDVTPIFGAGGVKEARSNRILQVRPGQIICFWDIISLKLQHSMIALKHNEWIGTNNQGCFGHILPGRRVISNINNIRSNGNLLSTGWIDDGNIWMGQYGKLKVTCSTRSY